MIRTTWRLALAGLMLLAPLSAQALGVSVVGVSSSGASTSVLQNGDVLTVDLVVENAGNLDVFGLGLDARGYDANGNGIADDGLVLAGGQVSSALFSTFYDAGLGSFGGIDNIWSAPEQKGRPGNLQGLEPIELHAVLFEGVALSASNGDGSLDTGIGGSDVGSGDIHFRVQFMAMTAGLPGATVFNLDFGTHPEFGNVAIGAGGSTLAFVNDSLSVTVVPEPGTALLIGLGLAGLATAGRRR